MPSAARTSSRPTISDNGGRTIGSPVNSGIGERSDMRRLTCVGLAFGLLVCTAGTAPFVHGQIGDDAPIWADVMGHPIPDAHEALAILRNAADDGLDPDDYDSASLDGLA